MGKPRTKSLHTNVRRSFEGQDSLGKFELTRFADRCGICRENRGLGKAYIIYLHKPKVSAYVAKAPSLLLRDKKTKNFIRTVGINCGCYAKVHRQIAHIEGGEK